MTRLISRALVALGWGRQASTAAALGFASATKMPLPRGLTVTDGVHTAAPLAVVGLD